jgi:hypothetical protein
MRAQLRAERKQARLQILQQSQGWKFRGKMMKNFHSGLSDILARKSKNFEPNNKVIQ